MKVNWLDAKTDVYFVIIAWFIKVNCLDAKKDCVFCCYCMIHKSKLIRCKKRLCILLLLHDS